MHSISQMTGVTYNQVKNDRRAAELLGVLPMVLINGPVIRSDEQVIEQLGFEGF